MREEHIELLHSEPAGPPVVLALDRLIDEDRILFEIDVNERSITHRLALYLQRAFPGWHVDCEYNRDEFETKELELPELKPDREDSNAQTVFPDIIVHRRNTNQNYLVIEAKKTSSHVSRNTDFYKLREYKKQLGYKYGLFIEFCVRPHAPGINYVEWIDP